MVVELHEAGFFLSGEVDEDNCLRRGPWLKSNRPTSVLGLNHVVHLTTVAKAYASAAVDCAFAIFLFFVTAMFRELLSCAMLFHEQHDSGLVYNAKPRFGVTAESHKM